MGETASACERQRSCRRLQRRQLESRAPAQRDDEIEPRRLPVQMHMHGCTEIKEDAATAQREVTSPQPRIMIQMAGNIQRGRELREERRARKEIDRIGHDDSG